MGRRARIIRHKVQHRKAIKGYAEVVGGRPFMARTMQRMIHASTRKEYRASR